MVPKFILIVNDELVDNASTKTSAKQKLKQHLKKDTDWWSIYELVEHNTSKKEESDDRLTLRD